MNSARVLKYASTFMLSLLVVAAITLANVVLQIRLTDICYVTRILAFKDTSISRRSRLSSKIVDAGKEFASFHSGPHLNIRKNHELFESDFVSIYDFNRTAAITKTCRACALVTSSGHLLNSSAGADINMADCVFRMNLAPVRGYERDVGNRTTVRFVAHSSLHFIFHSKYRKPKDGDILEQNDGLKYIVTFGPEENMCDGCWRVQGLRSWMWKYPQVEVYLLSSAAGERYHDVFIKEMRLDPSSKLWMTTGFYTLNFMRKFCRSVVVFGMGRPGDSPCLNPIVKNVPYHYWESPSYTECNEVNLNEKTRMNRTGTGHSFQRERRMMENWKKIYNITFRYPDW